MIVGGREFNQSKHDVEQAMLGEAPEPFRKHLVEVNGQAFPPKQVLARATGWERRTFTTMEAQRVLTKLGFSCRQAGHLADGRAAWFPFDGKMPSPMDHLDAAQRDELGDERIRSLEAAVRTAQTAIAGLAARVAALESNGGGEHFSEL